MQKTFSDRLFFQRRIDQVFVVLIVLVDRYGTAERFLILIVFQRQQFFGVDLRFLRIEIDSHCRKRRFTQSYIQGKETTVK